MYFPALLMGLRRLGRWLLYEMFRVALWLAFALHTLSCLRSAWGGGGELAGPRGGRAIRPRRPGPARGRFTPNAVA